MAASITLKVGGMTCNHCRMAVEKALRTLAGVQDARVDLAAQEARVTYDPARVDEEALKKAIAAAGYEVL